MTYRISVVSAGLRSPSSTKLLAESLAEQAGAAFAAGGEQVQITHVELREHAHGIVAAMLTGFPTGELKAAVAATTSADALIVVSPTFSASFSGLFKSFFDIIDTDAVRGRPVLLAACGGTERHSLVLEHALRPLFSYLGAITVRTGVYAATGDFGGATSAALGDRIAAAATELAQLTVALGRRRPAADEFAGFTPFAQLLDR